MITLHNLNNPDQEVFLESRDISGIAPFGSGSAVECDAIVYAIHETPEEVEAIRAQDVGS
jgi:hypothetical protein